MTQLRFVSGPVKNAVVTVKLNSIQHVAERGDQVGDKFNLRMQVTDGIYPIEEYKVEVDLPPGSMTNVNSFQFNHVYYDVDCDSIPVISFLFEAATDISVGIFEGKTTGSNSLQPGVMNFTAPVEVVTGSSQSTLIFRGTIHVSCGD